MVYFLVFMTSGIKFLNYLFNFAVTFNFDNKGII
jgi:hypothetical protein